MAHIKLRDRDAIITAEGLIFRVYGYSHPPYAYICDPEYAPATIFRSTNSKALRTHKQQVYYKFYDDEGLQFIMEDYSYHTILHEPIQSRVVAVSQDRIAETRRPSRILKQLLQQNDVDKLICALQRMVTLVTNRSGLATDELGVFGSILHGFYNPQFSDLDLVVYGNLDTLQKTLKDLYEEGHPFSNEFERARFQEAKTWRFLNLSLTEYAWHQRRKMIYGLFHDSNSKRTIKTEFEPVKQWNGICTKWNSSVRIFKKGWIKATARITEDKDAAYIPSIYGIEPIRTLEGARVENITRILSYVEEFRMQAMRDEEVYVEGTLEEVVTPTATFHQITLTHCPRYYEQVLKILKRSC